MSMKLYWLQFLTLCEHGTIVIFLTAALLLPARTASAQELDPGNSAPLSAADAAPPDLPDAPTAVTAGRDAGDVPIQDKPHSESTVWNFPKHVALDMGHIVVSPVYLRGGDLKWLLPLAGASATAFATDSHTMLDVVSRSPTLDLTSLNKTSIDVSDGLRGVFMAAPAGMFVVGQVTHNEHTRESGLLGVEAMTDAYILGEVVKLSSYRERPLTDNAQGEFFIGKAGTDGSFISGHALTAWSSAAVLAAEYRSPWAQVGIYSLASGVSVTRVLGQQHFPSDVLIGSAAGWLIGHYVYRAHRHFHEPHASLVKGYGAGGCSARATACASDNGVSSR